ncbi:hypothetical protein CO612_07320 [Lysobacteraceae bacterium NML71-0210]|nr:hypothetical protein CO612_07320 [Xanthomonadaceae bacterium NML71-0210]
MAEFYIPVLQTIAFAASAVAALWLIWHNGQMAKRRAIVDLIIQQKFDEKLIEATNYVYKAYESQEQLGGLLDVKDDESIDKLAKLLRAINNLEFIAVGIRTGAFDEKVYKELQYNNVLKLWRSTSGFVYELRRREQKNTLFQDFERLAKRWERCPIKEIG